MNCLEFRRLKLIDPNRLTPHAQAHARECASCAEFARAQDAFELRLGEALRVPADTALGARVLLRQQLRREGLRRTFARAAALVLAFVLVLAGGVRLALPDAVLFDLTARHVALEQKAFMAEEKRSSGELQDALARSGAKVVKPINGNISYIHDCPVPGGLGKHIVVRTAQGTITLLTMPNKKVYLRRSKLKSGFAIAILPCKQGSVALVARSESELAALEAQLSQHVQWSA